MIVVQRDEPGAVHRLMDVAFVSSLGKWWDMVGVVMKKEGCDSFTSNL